VIAMTNASITNEQIIALRDGPRGLEDEALRAICVVALQVAVPTGLHPFCRVCSWRKGGRDSWDGVRCKCKLSAPPYFTCGTCGSYGRVPYDLGTQPCPSCDGSGLVDPSQIAIAREHCAVAWNAWTTRPDNTMPVPDDNPRV
jgi:hypothetical protein